MRKTLPVISIFIVFIVFLGLLNSWTLVFAQDTSSNSAEIQNNNETPVQLIYATPATKLTFEEKNKYCLSIYKQLIGLLDSLIQNYADMTTRVTNIYNNTNSFYDKYLKDKEPIEIFDNLSSVTANDKKNVLASLQSLKTETDKFSCNDLTHVKDIDISINSLKDSYISYNKNAKELLGLILKRYQNQKNITQQNK